MSGNLVIYVGTFNFVKDSQEVHGFNLIEFSKAGDKVNGRSTTLFSRDLIDVSNLQPGDIVDCGFEASQFLNAKPRLVSIKKVKNALEYLPFK